MRALPLRRWIQSALASFAALLSRVAARVGPPPSRSGRGESSPGDERAGERSPVPEAWKRLVGDEPPSEWLELVATAAEETEADPEFESHRASESAVDHPSDVAKPPRDSRRKRSKSSRGSVRQLERSETRGRERKPVPSDVSETPRSSKLDRPRDASPRDHRAPNPDPKRAVAPSTQESAGARIATSRTEEAARAPRSRTEPPAGAIRAEAGDGPRPRQRSGKPRAHEARSTPSSAGASESRRPPERARRTEGHIADREPHAGPGRQLRGETPLDVVIPSGSEAALSQPVEEFRFARSPAAPSAPSPVAGRARSAARRSDPRSDPAPVKEDRVDGARPTRARVPSTPPPRRSAISSRRDERSRPPIDPSSRPVAAEGSLSRPSTGDETAERRAREREDASIDSRTGFSREGVRRKDRNAVRFDLGRFLASVDVPSTFANPTVHPNPQLDRWPSLLADPHAVETEHAGAAETASRDAARARRIDLEQRGIPWSE